MENENFKRLSEKMPEEAIQRTRKIETKKGYDTDGYGYQYVVDRFNDVCGLEWGFSWKIENSLQGKYKSGQPYYELTVSVDIWVGDKEHVRGCAGGHTSSNYSDALKGAITNAFKKSASFWGVGRDAYAGTIDDDNVPLPASDKDRVTERSFDEMYAEIKEMLGRCTNLKGLILVGEQIKNYPLPEEMLVELRKIFDEKRKTFMEDAHA